MKQGVYREDNMSMVALSVLRTYQGLELVRGGNKVSLAVDLDQDAQAGPGMDVRRNGALRSHSAGLLVSARETLLAKPLQRKGGYIPLHRPFGFRVIQKMLKSGQAKVYTS